MTLCRCIWPPTAGAESIRVTEQPQPAAVTAAARPAGPEPTTATSTGGASGGAQEAGRCDHVAVVDLDQAGADRTMGGDVHQAVEADADRAEDAARTAAGAGTAPGHDAVGEQGAADRHAAFRFQRGAVEGEADGIIGHGGLRRTWRERRGPDRPWWGRRR